MKKNMGSIDKTLRIIFALLIVILFYLKVITGTFGIVLLVFAGIFLLTSFISFCPLYTIFGFSTCPMKKK
ncbi:MAG: DUF2892 domain-containing protein [Bacteroidales bacterium]|jgi:uncharacterized membrane protein|nr:DUF2892 domain-containing protein [Bacteroidales bacterium]